MRTVINWGVFGIFGVLILGFIVAGFLVPGDAKTDDGHPLNIFFFVMAGFFFITNVGVITWATLSNRRRAHIESTWYDAPAEIIEVSETGTYINNQPKLKFKLLVQSPVHPSCEVIHKQVIPLTALSQYARGTTITVKVNPDNPEDILLV